MKVNNSGNNQKGVKIQAYYYRNACNALINGQHGCNADDTSCLNGFGTDGDILSPDHGKDNLLLLLGLLGCKRWFDERRWATVLRSLGVRGVAVLERVNDLTNCRFWSSIDHRSQRKEPTVS